MTPGELLQARGLAVSPAGARCAALLAAWLGGAHHLPGGPEKLHKIRWDGWSVTISVFTFGLSTADGADLTRLVLLAHDHAIRVVLAPGGPKRLRIDLFPRARHSPELAHPTIDDALRDHRMRHSFLYGRDPPPCDSPADPSGDPPCGH